MPEADALGPRGSRRRPVVDPEGADALAYLTGLDRYLTPETIRPARLGVTSWVAVPKAEGTTFKALGVVVPWFNGGRLALVKIRQPGDRRPKYAEAFRDPARLVCYPGPEVVRPGRPLVVTEGEFDALCLGEALGELAAVMTLGSANARPDPRSLGVMLSAPRWFIATDADPAGDKAALDWPARARRVRPPSRSRIGRKPDRAGWTWPGGGRTSWPGPSGPRRSPGMSYRGGGGDRPWTTTIPASTTQARGFFHEKTPPGHPSGTMPVDESTTVS